MTRTPTRSAQQPLPRRKGALGSTESQFPQNPGIDSIAKSGSLAVKEEGPVWRTWGATERSGISIEKSSFEYKFYKLEIPWMEYCCAFVIRAWQCLGVRMYFQSKTVFSKCVVLFAFVEGRADCTYPFKDLGDHCVPARYSLSRYSRSVA